MAIYKNASLTVTGNDISSDLRSLAFNHSAEEADDSAMGDDTRSSAGSLERWTIEGEVNQQFGAGNVDAVFATRIGTTVGFVLRAYASATKDSANPKYTGTGLITEYVPMSGSVGDQFIGTFSIVSAGSLTRTVPQAT